VRITHHGHACVVIEDPVGPRGRILIDPGDLAGEIDGAGPIDSVLITHEHPDHLELNKLQQLRRANPTLDLYVNEGTRQLLPTTEQEIVTVLSGLAEVSKTMISGWDVVTHTSLHSTIYHALPASMNNAYFINGRVWHPGDSFMEPTEQIDILMLPIGAPWMKLSESIDFLRAVAPRVAIPIHQGGLAPAHRDLHCNLLAKFAPESTKVQVLAAGVPVDF